MEFKQIDLTPVQRKAWEQTRTGILWQTPGFAHILYTMMNATEDERMLYWTNDIETLATDGSRIMVNPEFFFGLNLFERIAAVVHEVIHGVLDHCGSGYRIAQMGKVSIAPGKELDYDPEQANIAQDLIINDMLVQSKIGKLGQGWLHDTKIATQHDNWVSVYAKIYKKGGAGGGGGGAGKGGSSGMSKGRFDKHLPPGATTGQQPHQVNRQQQAWKNAIASAHAITKEAHGQDAAGILKFFEQFLEPHVSWVDQIIGTFARKVGSGGYDYRKPDRRMIVRNIFVPGRSGHGAGTVVIGVDTSGSIYAVKNLIDRFFAEMAGLLADVKPRRLIVMECDAHVHKVHYIDDEMDLVTLRTAGVTGGGGTSFVPVFEKIKELDITDVDALVYLTDGFGSFPSEAPEYPVIWGDITHKKGMYPFGDVVEIPSDGTA